MKSYYQYNPAVFLGDLSDISESDGENDARRVPVNEVIPPEIHTKQRQIIIHADAEDPELNPAAAVEESEENPALNPEVLPEEERVAVPRPDEPEPATEERDGTYFYFNPI